MRWNAGGLFKLIDEVLKSLGEGQIILDRSAQLDLLDRSLEFVGVVLQGEGGRSLDRAKGRTGGLSLMTSPGEPFPEPSISEI